MGQGAVWGLEKETYRHGCGFVLSCEGVEVCGMVGLIVVSRGCQSDVDA